MTKQKVQLTDRVFYRTVISVIVLSEDSYNPKDLAQVQHDITEGDCSGFWKIHEPKQLNGRQAVQALQAQGSSPEFFRLTEKGEDIY
jgi:hypothetical protein